VEGKYRCNHKFGTFVKRVRINTDIPCCKTELLQNENLHEETPIVLGLYKYIKVKRGNWVVTSDIFENYDDKVPRYTVGKFVSWFFLLMIHSHRLADNCKVLGTLKTDLSSIPRYQLDRVIGKDGHEYYRVVFEIIATFYSADIKVEFVFKGKRYSSISLVNPTRPNSEDPKLWKRLLCM
jgi:hypothetical protein